MAVITLQNVSQTAKEPEVPKYGARRSRNAGQTSVAPATAGTGRTWVLAWARAEGISIRTLAAAIGLSPSRMHQFVAGTDGEHTGRQAGAA